MRVRLWMQGISALSAVISFNNQPRDAGEVTVTKQEIISVLERIDAQGLGNLAGSERVSDIFIADGKVYFSITVPADKAQVLEPVRLAAEQAVASLPGVDKAVVTLTAAKQAGSEAAAGQKERSSPLAHSRARETTPSGQAPPRAAGKLSLPGVSSIVAVASGKGGVGKSTTAANLALAFHKAGMRVGILDADIYGPSMPRLMGATGKPELAGERRLMPKEAYGLKVMSIGFLVEEETPMIWRGPMVISALTQMLNDVEWGELDILVVDMPPGTGDAQLTMAQKVPLAGAVIVSTPQDLALIDARKGLNMFRRVDVPVLGIVENMSYFLAPDTGKRYDIFGHGGAKAEAERLGVPFLGEVPLTMNIRETSDAGKPIVVADPDGEAASVYAGIADNILQQLNNPQAAAPEIIFE